MASETIEVTGHIVDSLLLAKILDTHPRRRLRLRDRRRGHRQDEPRPQPSARIDVTGDDEVLGRLVDELQVHGANRVTIEDATLVPADRDGVLPAGFYSTTNLASGVRVDGTWLPVENPEMDCALVVRDGRAETVPMHRVRAGDMVVVGSEGVQVQAPSHARTPRCSSSWRRRCRPRSPRPCWWRGWPSACAPPATGAVGCWWWPGLRSSTPAGPPTWPGWSRPAGSTCCSPATASPPTTSRRTCSARRSACRSRRAPPPRAATPTTSGSSTRCGGTARSPPRSTPGS